MQAFSSSVTTFVGQNFGARKQERIRKSVHIAAAQGFGMTLLIIALLFGFSRHIAALFTDDAAVITISMQFIRHLSPFYAAYTLTELYGGVLRGCGETFAPMCITGVTVCLMRTVWVLVLPVSFGIWPTVACYPVTWTLSSLLCTVYYFKGGWRKRVWNPSA
jgi:Na+-driven multidrug efflux pump